ncbi:MAG: hypothetical protein AB1521_13030 [Bacteroidota bacterium]
MPLIWRKEQKGVVQNHRFGFLLRGSNKPIDENISGFVISNEPLELSFGIFSLNKLPHNKMVLIF